MRKRRKGKRLLDMIIEQETEADLVATLDENVGAIDDAFLAEVGGNGQRLLDSGDADRALGWFTIGAKASRIASRPGDAAQFFTSAGFAAQSLGEADEAAAHFTRARDDADLVLGDHEAETFKAWIAASQQLAFALARGGRADLAAELLREVRVKSHDLGEPIGELIATMQLTSLHLEAEDWATATQYGRLASDAWDGAEDGLDPRQVGVFREQLATLLVELAKHVYYEEQDWDIARDLATRATRLVPDEQAPLFILGMCQIHLEEYEAAVRTWRRALEIAPDLPAHYTNLAQALLGLGRQEEAFAALEESLVRKPNQPRQRLAFAQLLASASRHEDALAQLDRLLAELAPQLEAEQTPVPVPRSQLDYEARMPLQDIFDFARIVRVGVLMALGRLGEARSGADELIEGGDDPTRISGLALKGELEESTGDTDAAVALYTAALDEDPGRTDARKRRVTIARSQGDSPRMMEDLFFLAADREDPQFVIELATAMLAEKPQDAELYKLRGYAHWQAWRPSLAAPDFAGALERISDDSDLLVWQSLNLITYSPLAEEEEWNDGFSFERIYDAVEGLGRAATIEPDHPEAISAYKWLIDRAETNPIVRLWLQGAGDTEFGMFTLIPGYKDLLERQWEAFTAAEERRWQEAAAEHDRVSVGFEMLGLPVTAARCQINVADNYLRLYELQLATTHLHRARLADLVRARPLSAELAPSGERFSQQSRDEGGVGAGAVEIDYLPIYELSDQAFDVSINLLEAQLHTRIGDPEKAVEAMGDVDYLFADPAATLRAGIGFQALRSVIAVLRDAGDLDRALALADKLAPFASLSRDRLGLESTRATIHDLRGEHDLAAQRYAEVRRIAGESDTTVGASLDLQYAGSLVNSGRLPDAAPVLEAIDIGDLTSDNDRQLFHWLAALGHEHQRDYTAALASLEDAFEILEGTRAELLSHESRMTWQGRQSWLYSRGVVWALELGDVSRAFDYVERSKARSFVDLLAHADVPLPEEASRLVTALDQATARRGVLEQLADAAWLRRSFINVDLIARLDELGGHEGLIERSAAGDVLSPEELGEAIDEVDRKIVRLRGEIEERRLAVAGEAGEQALRTGDVRRILSGEPPGPDGSRSMLLAEYFTTPDAVLIFLLRSEDDQPHVVRIEADSEAVWQTVGRYLDWLIDGVGDLSRDVEKRVAGFVRPVVEHARESEFICLVPHGALHYLPLHGVAIDGRAMLDSHPVTYAPSASALGLLRHDAAQAVSSGVVIGDSLGDLPYGRAEARLVAGVLGAVPRLGTEATKRGLLESLAATDELGVLHVACHGFFDPEQALKSGLHLAQEPGLEGADSVLSAEEVLGLDIPAELVVLSACESGLNEIRPGEELFGLARAFFAAGAPSVVVSLWSVDDMSTSFLFGRFYELLAAGVSKSDALREAALFVRDLTVGEALAVFERREESLGPEAVDPASIVLGRARLHAYGADASSDRDLAMARWRAREDATGGVSSGDRLSAELAALASDSGSAEEIDFSRRPFDHPFYWAAFQLVGHWR